RLLAPQSPRSVQERRHLRVRPSQYEAVRVRRWLERAAGALHHIERAGRTIFGSDGCWTGTGRSLHPRCRAGKGESQRERVVAWSPVRGWVAEVREAVRRGQPPIRGRRSVTAAWIDVQGGAEVEPESGGRGRGWRLRSPARFRHRREVAAGFTFGIASATGARPRALTDRHAPPWPRARDRQRRAAVRAP